MDNIPQIFREENDARRDESIIERAVAASLTEGPLREKLSRGGIPTPPPPSVNSDGEPFFVFGNPLDDGAALAP
jgi:hypothetical protein